MADAIIVSCSDCHCCGLLPWQLLMLLAMVALQLVVAAVAATVGGCRQIPQQRRGEEGRGNVSASEVEERGNYGFGLED